MTTWERTIVWTLRAVAAISGAILLTQIEFGWQGWEFNITVLVPLVLSAFGIGMIRWENR